MIPSNTPATIRGDHVATILGYASTTDAIDGFDDDDLKSLRELNPDLIPQCMDDFYTQGDLFVSCYGICSLVYRSKKQDANKFNRWVWSDIIPVVRRKASCTPPEHCSDDDDDEESTCSEDGMVGREEEEEEDGESLCNRLIEYIHRA